MIGLIVVLENGETRLYQCPWASHAIPSILFWGPAESIKVAESGVLSEAWCSPEQATSGALIDLDHQRLYWYGAHTELRYPHSPAVFQRLLEIQWPDFQVQYAHGDLTELAEASGVLATNLPSVPSPDPHRSVDDELFGETDDEDDDLYDGFDKVWICLTDNLGESHNYVVTTFPWEPLVRGAPMIETLAKIPSAPVPAERLAAAGVHVNMHQQSITVWGTRLRANRFSQLTQAWPGYEISWQPDGYRWQAETTRQMGSAILMTDDELLSAAIVDLESDMVKLDELESGCTSAVQGLLIRGAGCLSLVIVFILGLVGLITRNWQVPLVLGGTMIGILMVAVLWLLVKARSTIGLFGESIRMHEAPYAPGPEDESERIAEIDRVLENNGSASFAEMQRIAERLREEDGALHDDDDFDDD